MSTYRVLVTLALMLYEVASISLIVLPSIVIDTGKSSRGIFIGIAPCVKYCVSGAFGKIIEGVPVVVVVP